MANIVCESWNKVKIVLTFLTQKKEYFWLCTPHSTRCQFPLINYLDIQVICCRGKREKCVFVNIKEVCVPRNDIIRIFVVFFIISVISSPFDDLFEEGRINLTGVGGHLNNSIIQAKTDPFFDCPGFYEVYILGHIWTRLNYKIHYLDCRATSKSTGITSPSELWSLIVCILGFFEFGFLAGWDGSLEAFLSF